MPHLCQTVAAVVDILVSVHLSAGRGLRFCDPFQHVVGVADCLALRIRYALHRSQVQVDGLRDRPPSRVRLRQGIVAVGGISRGYSRLQETFPGLRLYDVSVRVVGIRGFHAKRRGYFFQQPPLLFLLRFSAAQFGYYFCRAACLTVYSVKLLNAAVRPERQLASDGAMLYGIVLLNCNLR